MSISASHSKVSALALVLALGGCGKEVALGGGTGEGGNGSVASAVASTGTGAIEDCSGKACGTYCSAGGNNGWCDGDGSCLADYLCLHQPCAGKACGDACEPCDPSAPAADCPGETSSFACDLGGKCRPAGFSCGPCDYYNEPDCPYDPCLAQNLPCGAPCDPGCDPTDQPCLAAASLVCNGNHECRPEQEVKCDPCIDPITQAPKLCGQDCSQCETTPWLACDRPISPSGITVCDGQGACMPPEIATACPGGYEPCSGATCGATCSLCDPMDPGCWPGQQLQCNEALQCVGAAQCIWNGCDGKSCGEQCFPCDPNQDVACASVVTYCDAYLACVLDQPGVCP